MKKVTTEQLSRPESELDPEVLAFRSQFNSVSPLDELVRQGAQQMLQTAVGAPYHDTEPGAVVDDGIADVFLPDNDSHLDYLMVHVAKLESTVDEPDDVGHMDHAHFGAAVATARFVAPTQPVTDVSERLKRAS